MPGLPWPQLPLTYNHFRTPPREFGILPFWFLNGELDPDEMRWQLREFREKGMPGIILHGRFGLEHTYLGPTYLDRISLAIEEGERLGLKTWIYDEMNWPSGTADWRVVRERPDLTQRYLECLNFNVRGPWFTYLTGMDSRYVDFERSTPVAAFAFNGDGQVVDLTPNLSFENVIPWQAPPGNWRLLDIVEKEADYYIDALNPEATAEFLRIGYDPYVPAAGSRLSGQMPGFYTDEPAMHYYVTGGDNAIVPWTRDMFRRFQQRNGYNLRPRLPDLFFDISPDSARVRYDFYNTLTDFYSDAFYRQIHEWCQAHDVLFTGHLLDEEWLRMMIRVEGNPFKHYVHMDVIGVDHLYPYIGNRDRPAEHVAMKLASSAAHQYGSERLLCESFGGIFMDATMQRMKWITDWEYVLGVNLLNPHGFHYTLEGPRKRDWPPSMFYQYPWWHYYGHFSDYVSRLSYLLTGGRHVAKVAILWPINAMFATYTPQSHNQVGDRIENDFNTLTDLLLRLHYDYDYLDEDVLAGAELDGAAIRVRDEAYELLVVPPMAHLKLATVERLEQFVQAGGRLLGAVFLPDQAFGPDGLVDVSERIEALFGIAPRESRQSFREQSGIDVVERDHPSGGKSAFVRSYALNRQLPMRLQRQVGAPGRPESPFVVIEEEGDSRRYWFAPPEGEREEITAEVDAERQEVAQALQRALGGLIEPDVAIDNPEVFYLHRVKDGQDVYFLVNPTFSDQTAQVTLTGDVHPMLWDPSTGEERLIAPAQVVDGKTRFTLSLPPVGSAFVVTGPQISEVLRTSEVSAARGRIVDTNIVVDSITDGQISGYGRTDRAYVVLERDGEQRRLEARAGAVAEPITLDGEWEFVAEDANALVTGNWLATPQTSGDNPDTYAAPGADTSGWLPMVPGAWSYQLPAEPEAPYPITVWYRVGFRAEHVPSRLDLVVDGFAGSEWRVYVNGEAVTAPAVRSTLDSQMKALDVTGHVRQGDNVIAVCLTLTNATDGLLDLVKLLGDFSIEQHRDGSQRIVAPRRTLKPAPWSLQGYPYYSGRGLYRRTFELPAEYAGQRLFLEPALYDDVLEVIVNGQPAGVRLWEPYVVEVTKLVRPGLNTLELRVANTPINVLEAKERLSGLAGDPKLVPYQTFRFDLEHSA
ncbi:MAG TPA: glycosyl hydrolase [Ardenticatenaceae bacterium]|nr:glycosyl hydrolase [Ardenticatenaceae bacterium]